MASKFWVQFYFSSSRLILLLLFLRSFFWFLSFLGLGGRLGRAGVVANDVRHLQFNFGPNRPTGREVRALSIQNFFSEKKRQIWGQMKP